MASMVAPKVVLNNASTNDLLVGFIVLFITFLIVKGFILRKKRIRGQTTRTPFSVESDLRS